MIEGQAGLFFFNQTETDIREAVTLFESREAEYDPMELNAHARKFDTQRVREEFAAVVEDVLRTKDTCHPRAPAG